MAAVATNFNFPPPAGYFNFPPAGNFNFSAIDTAVCFFAALQVDLAFATDHENPTMRAHPREAFLLKRIVLAPRSPCLVT